MNLCKKLTIALLCSSLSSTICTSMEGTPQIVEVGADIETAKTNYTNATLRLFTYVIITHYDNDFDKVIEYATLSAEASYAPAQKLLDLLNSFGSLEITKEKLKSDFVSQCADFPLEDKHKYSAFYAQICYLVNRFDEGFEYLSPHLREITDETPNLLLNIFEASPKAVAHFEKKLCSPLYLDVCKKSQALFLDVLYQLPDLPNQLSAIDLDEISARYWRVYSMIDKKQDYLDQAILYSLLSAKNGKDPIDVARSRLVDILKATEAYETYYSFLNPYLLDNDKNAQKLFHDVIDNCLDALSWFDQRMTSQLVNGEDSTHEKINELLAKNYNPAKDISEESSVNIPSALAPKTYLARKTVSEIINEGKTPKNLEAAVRHLNPAILEIAQEQKAQEAQEEYDTAIAMLDSGPHDALQRFLKSEKLGYPKAIEKLKEIRNSRGYKEPTKVDEFDLGRLLRSYEPSASDLYRKGMWLIGKTDSEALDNFIKSANLGSRDAKKELEKMRKSRCYKDAAQKKTDSIEYKLYEKDKSNGNLVTPEKKESKVTSPPVQTTKQQEKKSRKGRSTRRQKSSPNEPIIAQKADRTNITDPVQTTTSAPAVKPAHKERETTTTTIIVENPTISAVAEDAKEKEVHVASQPPAEERPEPTEKTQTTKVKKTLERKKLERKLSRRNSMTHIPTESNLDEEPKRRELRRTLTVTNLPSYSSASQGKTETIEGKTKQPKKTLSNKLSLSRFNPWKDKGKDKDKGSTTLEEMSKSKLSSGTSSNQSTSSEGGSIKSSQKLNRKTSSSSLSASEESFVEKELPENSLITKGDLPELAKDYYPRHDKKLLEILCQKFNLAENSDERETLRIILTGGKHVFQIKTTDIEDLCSKFVGFIKESKHGGNHRVIRGLGITLNPNANGIKEKAYWGQLEQAKEKIVRIIARTLTTDDDVKIQALPSLTNMPGVLKEEKK